MYYIYLLYIFIITYPSPHYLYQIQTLIRIVDLHLHQMSINTLLYST